MRACALEKILPALTAPATAEQSVALNQIVMQWAQQDSPAALRFAAELAKRGLRASSTTVLASPHSEAMRGLTKALGTAGVAVQLDAAARDLGVDAFTRGRGESKR